MPPLDKRKILKSASQLKVRLTPNPKNNYNQIGVSNRKSLSKAGYKPTSGWNRVHQIETFYGEEVHFCFGLTRKSGACKQ